MKKLSITLLLLLLSGYQIRPSIALTSSPDFAGEQDSFKVVIALIIIALIYITARITTRIYTLVRKESQLRALKLADIDNMNGSEFEHYVGRLLNHQGFKVEMTGASNDLGVDIIAQQNNLKYAIQAKRYTGHVSRRAVSDAVAGKFYYGCNATMVVTTSYFTKGAIELARSTGCKLVDRDMLAKWILSFQTQGSKVSSTH